MAETLYNSPGTAIEAGSYLLYNYVGEPTRIGGGPVNFEVIYDSLTGEDWPSGANPQEGGGIYNDFYSGNTFVKCAFADNDNNDCTISIRPFKTDVKFYKVGFYWYSGGNPQIGVTISSGPSWDGFHPKTIVSEVISKTSPTGTPKKLEWDVLTTGTHYPWYRIIFQDSTTTHDAVISGIWFKEYKLLH